MSPVLVPVHADDLILPLVLPLMPDLFTLWSPPDVTVVTVCQAQWPGVDWLVWSIEAALAWARAASGDVLSLSPLLAPHSPICSDCSVLTTHQNIPTYHQPHTRYTGHHQAISPSHWDIIIIYHHQKVLWMDDFISSAEMDYVQGVDTTKTKPKAG